MKQAEAMKRDNLVVAYLVSHRGADKCVSSKELAEYLCECGYKTEVGHIHTVVRKLIFERMLPICSMSAKGYFWAETQEEIKMAIAEMQGRIAEMQDRIELLNKFILK